MQSIDFSTVAGMLRKRETGTRPGTLSIPEPQPKVGVGLDVNLLPILSVRGEMRDFYSGAPQLNVDSGKSRQHNYFVGGGVVMHFQEESAAAGCRNLFIQLR